MTPDARRSAALAAGAALLFAPAAPFLGFYLDDYSFLRLLEGAGPAALWGETLRYVPGRNLHIPIFAALLRLTGSSPLLLHLVSAAFDAGLAAMAYLLARRLSSSPAVALVSGAAFILAPNHGETHFWVTLIPQCQVPLALTLGAFLLATRPTGPRLGAACGLFALALFTYDQVFLLWPLMLAAAWRSEVRPRPARYAAAAAGLAGLDALHLTARYLSPHASGGRPLIRVWEVLDRLRDAAMSIAKGVLPWPTASHAHWALTLMAALVALGTAMLLRRELTHARDDARAPSPRLVALFGAAWTALSYGPNLFWFISPRHNLIPSFGWTLALGALSVAVWRAHARARPALTAAGVLALTLAAVSNVHEATQWSDSRRMRDAFIDEVRRLPRPVEALFLHGAPRYLRRAPAFNLYHDVTLAAGRVLGEAPGAGDYAPVPTESGFIYFSDLSVHPKAMFHWTPAERAALISYDPSSGSFRCARALETLRPDGSVSHVALRPAPDCTAVPRLRQETALLDSRLTSHAVAGPEAPRVGGLALLSAEIRSERGVTTLDLRWAVEAPQGSVLALVPRPPLETVFPASAGRKRTYPVLWPLVDDRLPELRPRPGMGLRQTFALRRETPPDARVELDVYALTPGLPPRALGVVAAPRRL